MKPIAISCLAVLATATAAPVWAQLPAMRDRPLSAAERTRLASLEGDITRIAAQRNTSAAAVRAIARKLGTRLTTADPGQIIKAIDDRAIELAGARTRIGELEKELETLDSARLMRAVQPLLEAATKAIDEGELDVAEAKLAEAGDQFGQARTTLSARVDDLAAREADIVNQRGAVRNAGFDYAGAAALFEQAAMLAPAANAEKRWQYRLNQAQSLYLQGSDLADPQALAASATVLRDHALPLVPRASSPEAWAETQVRLGSVLTFQASSQGDPALRAEAAAAFRSAVDASSDLTSPADLAVRQSSLGAALVAQSAGDPTALPEAIAMLEQAAQFDGPRRPAALGNLANAYAAVAQRSRQAADYDRAIAAYDRMIETFTPTTSRYNRANAYANRVLVVGQRADAVGGDEARQATLQAVRQADENVSRDETPALWGTLRDVEGTTLRRLAEAEPDQAKAQALLGQAMAVYDAALPIMTRERSPTHWANLTRGRAEVLVVVGRRAGDTSMLRSAYDGFGAYQEVFTRERAPMAWATTRGSQAALLLEMAGLGAESEKAALHGQARQAFLDVAEAARTQSGGEALASRAEAAAAQISGSTSRR